MQHEEKTISANTTWWAWLIGVAVVALVLVSVGEKYPLTPFPMYSGIDSEADILYVVDQTDKPLAISSLFGVGSAQAKKRFETELLLLAKTKDYEKASAEKVREAGTKFLTSLWADRNAKKAEEAGITELKARVITVSVAAEGGFQKPERELAVWAVKP